MNNKQEYNELLKKINKAEKWLNSNNKHKDIEIYLNKFQIALNKASELIKSIEKELGREMTKEEVLNGFWEVRTRERSVKK